MKKRIKSFFVDTGDETVDIRKKYFYVFLFAIVLLSIYLIHIINKPAFFISQSDDNAAYIASKENFFALINTQYFKWTGRISGVILSYFSTKTGSVFYKVINPLFLILSGYSIARYFSKKVNVHQLLLAILCFGVISVGALSDGVFWYSGSYSYLVPVSLSLFSMIPYADSYFRDDNKIYISKFILICVTAIIAAMGQEQAAIVMVGAAVFFHISKIIKKQKISPMFFILTAIIIIFTIIDIKAPGNSVRWNREMAVRFPDFSKLTVLQHAKLGIYCFFNEIVNQFTIVLFALSGFIFYSYKRLIKKYRYLFILFLTQLALILAALLIQQSYPTSNGEARISRLFNFNFLLVQYRVSIPELLKQVSKLSILLGLAPFLFWAVFLVILIFFIYKLSDKPIFTLLCVAAAFFVMWIFYTSPTLFVSGERAYYVSYILFAIILYQIISNSKLYESKILFLNLFVLYIMKICIIINNLLLISH